MNPHDEREVARLAVVDVLLDVVKVASLGQTSEALFDDSLQTPST